MPSFSFVPQAPTPPLHPQFLSPGIGPFSPTLSPGGFFSGVSVNPYLNPAPGAPVLMVPHSPVSPHPPASPSWYMHYGGEPTGYFPPVHAAHPLAQEVTPGSSNESGSTAASGDDGATVAGDRPRASFVEESVLRRPLPASDPATREGSALATRGDAEWHMALPGPRAASTGQGQSFSQAVRRDAAAPAPIERPQPGHAHSSSVAQLENGLAQLDLGGANGATSTGAARDRRASWHVDSPSVEFGGAGGYFALGR